MHKNKLKTEHKTKCISETDISRGEKKRKIFVILCRCISSKGCHKSPLGGSKRFFSLSLEMRSLNAKCQQSHAAFGALGASSHTSSSSRGLWRPLACGSMAPVSASIFTEAPPLCASSGVLSSLCKDSSHGTWGLL